MRRCRHSSHSLEEVGKGARIRKRQEKELARREGVSKPHLHHTNE